MASESSGLDLKAFLAEQTLEGSVESEGAFTIAADKAMEKLSYFALPHESDWVLKVIQAANLWKVERVVVVQTRVATSFTFAPTPQPPQALLVQAFSAMAPNNTDPLHALAMALRSLVEQIGLSFVLAFRRDGITEEPIFAGDDTTQLSARTRAQWTHQKVDGIRLTVSHFRGNESLAGRYVPTLSKVDRRDISIMQTLQKRAFTSPIPIYLDGRRLNDPTQAPQMAVNQGFRLVRTGTFDGSRRFAAANLAWGEPAERLRWPCENPDRPWYLMRSADWRSIDVFIGPHGAFPRYPAPHRVVLTRQGVVCQTYRIPNTTLSTSVLLVIPSDTGRSDLSGLSLEPTEEELAEIRTLRQQVALSLLEFLEEIRAEPYQPPEETLAAEPSLAAPEEPGKAGFSIFTESLGRPAGRIWGSLVSAVELVRHHAILPARKELLLEHWSRHLLVELKAVGREFAVGDMTEE